MSLKPIRKAIFPVGGLGTRFLPATKSMPKEMMPVANKPLIQYAFEEAREAGIEEFIFITGRNKNIITNHFDHAYELQQVLSDKAKSRELEMTKEWLPEAGNIAFIRQQETLGLGHAVWCARNFIGDEPFAVILADEMLMTKPQNLLKNMIESYVEKDDAKANLIGVSEVAQEDVSKYGIVALATDGSKKVIDMVEKPEIDQAPSNLAIIGRYILQPEIFKVLETQEKGRGGEIQITDAMIKMLETHNFYAAHHQGARFDCGSPLGFLEANIAYSLEQSNDPGRIQAILKKYSK
jgi:UTP--glucose-1-phosphate uridylyltransferase